MTDFLTSDILSVPVLPVRRILPTLRKEALNETAPVVRSTCPLIASTCPFSEYSSPSAKTKTASGKFKEFSDERIPRRLFRKRAGGCYQWTSGSHYGCSFIESLFSQ